MYEVIFNIRILLLIVILLPAASNCKRIDRAEKFQDKEKPITLTSEQLAGNEKENRIIELQSKINRLKEEQKATDRMLQHYISTVSEIYKGLKDINTGYFDIYWNSELSPLERSDLKHKILNKIDQIKKVMDENSKLVKELRISPKEIEAYENLVVGLKDRLDIQRREIYQLSKEYFEMREKNLSLRERNFILTKNSEDLKSTISSLRKELKHVNRDHLEEKEKHNMKYILIVTPTSLLSYECTSQPLELKGKGMEIISNHSAPSFRFKPINRKKNLHSLEIFDWGKFWINGKFLVISANKNIKEYMNYRREHGIFPKKEKVEGCK